MVKIMDKKYKILIPKYLTLFRFIVAPVVLLLSIMKWYIPLIILVILAFLSNLIDNILNRVWRVNSKSRIKLDLVANKSLILVIVGWLMVQYPILITVFVLECILSIMNIYFYNKTRKLEVLKIGKWKDVLLSITLLTYLFLFVSFGTLNISYGFTYATINLQVLSILQYFIFYITYKIPSIESNTMHQKIMKEDYLEKTIVLNNIQSLDKEIYDIEKDQD